MASITPASPTIDPLLYEDNDDERDLLYKAPLEALINGTQTPAQAAQTMDSVLRADTAARLDRCIEHANAHNFTPEDRKDVDSWEGIPPPNASAIIEQWFRSYCRVCTAFAPYSEGQNRLIELLEELRKLPRWMAPEVYPDENGDTHEKEFWPIGYDWIPLELECRRYHLDVKPGYYRDMVAHKRWRNFQHTMARLTAYKFINCSPFNELSELQLGEPHRKRNLEHDIIAAAQWVIWPTECRYVYKECLKKETTTIYWYPWSKERWNFWKREFERVSDVELYDEETKTVARQAVQRMTDAEEEFDDEASGESDDD